MFKAIKIQRTNIVPFILGEMMTYLVSISEKIGGAAFLILDEDQIWIPFKLFTSHQASHLKMLNWWNEPAAHPVEAYVVLLCIFLMIGDVEHFIFSCTCWLSVSALCYSFYSGPLLTFSLDCFFFFFFSLELFEFFIIWILTSYLIYADCAFHSND